MPLLTRLETAVADTRPSVSRTLAGVAILVAVATLARLALTPVLGNTLWFPTYYPAALVGTLWLGWRAGLLLMLLSALAADFFFIPPPYEAAIGARDVAGILVFLVADGVIVLAGGLLRTALIRLHAAHEREVLLNAELQHRMKNTLAVVQGLIVQTARRAGDDPREFRKMVESRLLALGSAHDLLSAGGWQACELTQIVDRALAPFRGDGKLAVGGPPARLSAECCVPLVLALHELATNAVKYGALSNEQGRVDLRWSVGSEGVVVLRWEESGGPAVKKPVRRGLGSRLLAPQPGLHEVALEFRPEGVTCEIKVRVTERPAGEPSPAFMSSRAGTRLA